MRIAEFIAYQVCLPLKHEIKHASAARDSSDNLVVSCRLADGTLGWGEGVPRDYVTGETVSGAFEQLAATDLTKQLGDDCHDWPGVLVQCERFTPAPIQEDPRGCYGNALRCAVELSVLDAYGKRFGEPVSRVTALFPPAAKIAASLPYVQYSSAITAATPRRERISALKMRIYGFAQCKIKIGLPDADDSHRLRQLRRLLGPRMDIRLDANEAYSVSQAVEKIEPLLAYAITCIEQPVAHDEVAALADIRRRLPVPIMLDESLTSLADGQAAIQQGLCDLFNIRLSKCGGFINSLRIAALADRHGLRYQLGCHPGESGILSAAGRHWATSVANIRYCEGSYDRHILRQRLTVEDLTFRYGGWAAALTGPGLGVTVSPECIAQLACRQQAYRLL